MENTFEKVLLGSLIEFNGSIIENSYIYKPAYMKCDKELNMIYSQIQKLLRKKNRKLMNRYDTLKNESFSFEVNEVYSQGLKDAIKILKILGVLS